MGSNGFSSERKHKRVDLLKQLLDTNISTQGSSNPLEALLSGLDLGSLEGLMQKNKKSHHDDWDSKKKRHHDDCNDHDWDHKKKHDHDDCGCKKKKHDHDCKCKCDDDEGECDCSLATTALLGNISSALCGIISASPLDTAALFVQLNLLQDFLESDAARCLRRNLRNQLERVVERLLDFVSDPADIPRGQLVRLAVRLRRLRDCLGLPAILCPGPPAPPTVGEPITLPITVREQLLDLLTEQVVITTPTGIYGGTLVAVQADYIAVVAPTGTYLIPLDQIQTFTTE